MAVFNGNRMFSNKKEKTQPVVKIPKNVKQAFQVEKAYENGAFQIEPKDKAAVYDRCYVFEDINYINKNANEKKSFLTDLMIWLNSMDVSFKITLANTYQSMEDFLQEIRREKNRDIYPEIAKGIRQWQDSRLEETNPSVTTLRYLTVIARADNEANARIYLNALETTIMEAFDSWGSRIERLNAAERLKILQAITLPGKLDEQPYISDLHPERKNKRDWKNDILPNSIKQYRNFMIMGKTYVTVLFGAKYRKTVDSDSVIRSLANVSYPSVITMDFAPVETDVVNDKLTAAQMNNERAITEEMEKKRGAGILAIAPSYSREKKKKEIENYIDMVDENDEKGFFMNLLMIITAEDEDTLSKRMREVQALGKREGVLLETCDFTQLKAWNTALPVGGRQVDYMRFFLSSSLVAFQPYYAQDVIEPGGQMMGLNRTTKHFIIADRKRLPNPHGIIVGYSGYGKSMYIKLTELAQTLLATDDDIMIIDPQNEFLEVCKQFGGSCFDLTPKSGIYLNGFEVSQEVFSSSADIKKTFIGEQTEYAKALCTAIMSNIIVTQEHDSIISKCTERMFQEIFAQKKLKKQPTLVWLREEIRKELQLVDNAHDENLIRTIYNSLEEYTNGSCDMLSRPSNVRIDSRLVCFGMSNVPKNNWEAVMVTVLHYLSVRMTYNKRYQRATHLIIDETQVVSKKPGSAEELSNAVVTFRKFGGIVTMAMQNVTAALTNQSMVELYSNCSYKCFFHQAGDDANSLAAIQKLSTKEFQAVSAGKVGKGVMVWNEKIMLFDAIIDKDNALYRTYNTDFHEKARNGGNRSDTKAEKLSAEPEEREMHMDAAGEKETPRAFSEKDRSLVLQIADAMDISEKDVAEILGVEPAVCRIGLKEMVKEGFLQELTLSDKYRKVG